MSKAPTWLQRLTGGPRKNPQAAIPYVPQERRRVDLRKAINAVSDVVQNRPRPLRVFDQIHMKTGDMVLQSEMIADWADGKRLAFIGDGDAISVCVAYLKARDVLNFGPSHITVFDFDERTVNAVMNFADPSIKADDIALADGRRLHRHVVQSGQDLSDVARIALGDPKRTGEIIDLNRTTVLDPARLYVGQVLNVVSSSMQRSCAPRRAAPATGTRRLLRAATIDLAGNCYANLVSLAGSGRDESIFSHRC